MTPSLQRKVHRRVAHAVALGTLSPSGIERRGMEHLWVLAGRAWSQAGATGGNRSQMGLSTRSSSAPDRVSVSRTDRVSRVPRAVDLTGRIRCCRRRRRPQESSLDHGCKSRSPVQRSRRESRLDHASPDGAPEAHRSIPACQVRGLSWDILCSKRRRGSYRQRAACVLRQAEPENWAASALEQAQKALRQTGPFASNAAWLSVDERSARLPGALLC
jgi:hypothetical protein